MYELNKETDKFQNEGSDWVFMKIENFYIHINRYNPLTASGWIEVPEHWQNKKVS